MTGGRSLVNDEHKRPRFQFRLKSLLFVTLALAVLFSVCGRVIQNYHAQQEAREKLVALGGWVQSEPVTGLKWLAPLFGEDYFTDVRIVAINPWRHRDGEDLRNWNFTSTMRQTSGMLIPLRDEHLELLKSFPNLERLSLDFTEVSDAAMVHLAGAEKLTDLSLALTGVTDAGLARLTHLKNLEHLDLFGTRVTDAGIAHLAKLPKLKRLDLRGTQVTDEGEQLLRQHLPNVEILRRPLDGPVRSRRLEIER